MSEDIGKYKIVIIAGEVSGDMHGAKLISALNSIHPELAISGIGGDLMTKEGLQVIYHIEQMAFLGIGEILKHLPFIRRVFKDMVQYICSNRPDAVVLIDYPGFNLKLAKAVSKRGISIIYYISPQLWAWGKRRVKIIKKYVDKMMVIFPFEVSFYQQFGIETEYVGHPLVDSHYNKVVIKESKSQGKIVLGLLPGSRKQEVENLLPDMLVTASILKQKGKIDAAVIARSNTIPLEYYQEQIKGYDFVSIHQSSLDEFYITLDVALVSSGTATLETAYFQVPMVIVYRVNPLTWFLGKLLVNLDYIGLANIVAGEKIADELLQGQFIPDKAASLLGNLLEPEINKGMREKLKIIQQKLGAPGASLRAAQSIIKYLKEKN